MLSEGVFTSSTIRFCWQCNTNRREYMLNAFLSELTACVPHYSIAELKWSLESRKKNHAQQHFISHWKCDPSICCIFHSFKSVNSPHFRIEKKKSKEDKKTYPTQKKSMRKLNNKCKKKRYTPEDFVDFASWMPMYSNEDKIPNSSSSCFFSLR